MFNTARRVIGQAKINNAIDAFDKISADLEDGIQHLNAHLDEHTLRIAQSQQAMRETHVELDRAQRVQQRVKAIIE